MGTTINNNMASYTQSATSTNANKNITAESYSLTATENENSIIGKDTFLQLMIAKLSNQDPLNPTDDTEFLAQLAQFTTLEQMVNMTDTITLQQGFDMAGKYVIASYNGSFITGRVDSVIYDSGDITLDIGGALVSMDSVKEVLAEAINIENSGTETTPDTENEAGDATDKVPEADNNAEAGATEDSTGETVEDAIN